MTDVFLSYSREDETAAARFAAILESAGLSVWWDRKIPPGKTWDQVIGKALDEAKCVVVLWTKTSVASDWVKEEAARGARRGARVPALLDDVEAPLGFGRIEAAELAGWDGDLADPEFLGFLSAVQECVGRPVEAVRPPSHGRRLPPWRRFLRVGGPALVAVVAGAALWLWLGGRRGPDLVVKIWPVVTDAKGPLKGSRSFAPASGRAGPGAAGYDLVPVAEWIAEQTAPAAAPVEVHLEIPEDPATRPIQLRSEPRIALDTFLYVSGPSRKARVKSQLRPEDLAFAGDEFAIEVTATGYDSIPVQVVLGQAQDRTFQLKPLPVKVAVEELTGGANDFAARLSELLATNPRIRVFGPEALDELRRELERNREAIGVNRAAQVAIRDTLGVDYIVGGRLGGE